MYFTSGGDRAFESLRRSYAGWKCTCAAVPYGGRHPAGEEEERKKTPQRSVFFGAKEGRI